MMGRDGSAQLLLALPDVILRRNPWGQLSHSPRRFNRLLGQH